MRKLALILSFSITQLVFSAHTLTSPDRKIKTTIVIDKDGMSYQVKKDGHEIVKKSKLGMMIRDRANLIKNMRLVESTSTKKDESWEQPWGENRVVRNKYNELRFELKHLPSGIKMNIEFRAFNDGVAFRYLWPEQEKLKDFEIWDEATEFHFSQADEAWWIPAFKDNRYEYLYEKNVIKDLNAVHTPVTIEQRKGHAVSLHEAKLIDFPSMALKNIGDGILKADLVPWSDGIRARLKTPHQSSWRTITIADEQKDLIASTMILNLNDPNVIEDTSWITTGKYIGIWWGMHLEKYTWGASEKLGATTENTKEYIDFAAKHGFHGVLVEGWNIGWDGNWYGNGEKFRFYEANPEYDVDYLADYAKSKGVTLVGHHETASITTNYEAQMEKAFDFMKERSIKAVKTGYVGTRLDYNEWHHGQHGVRHYNKAMREGAKKEVMMIVHEPIKQTGLRRTYPNLMSAEGARGQEYDAWSGDGGNPPDHTTILPFTRMLAGPMDFTPGTFDLIFDNWRPHNRVNTTLAKQLALYLVIYSPWQMASDLPENYERFPEAFEFIKNVPTDWEKTVPLDSKIADYTVIARQDRFSEKWYVGAITDENGRTVTIDLDFLDSGSWYKVKAYQDARNASWTTNPYAMEIYETEVNAEGTFDLHLAPGGGLALEFEKIEE